MQRKPGSGGRQKRISGSGSVFRRGSGLGTGPVGSGGGFGGNSGSSGDRGGRGGGSMGLIALLIAYPVSYTHLDVYKRQVKGG